MAMKDTVRVGVIGLGGISPSHIYAIHKTEGAELTAVCDVNPAVAERVGSQEQVAWFTGVESMADAGKVDAVTICTPSGYHREAALIAARRNLHLLIEKPIDITVEGVDEIIHAADESGVVLAGVFQSRYLETIQMIKKLLSEDFLGQIYSGSVYIKRYRSQEYYDSSGWRGTWDVDGGGCLMNQGIHFIDIFQYLMGDIADVRAFIDSRGRDVDVETMALALVNFKSGASGVIEATTLAYPEFPPRMEIYGSGGSLVFAGQEILSCDLVRPDAIRQQQRAALLDLSRQVNERDLRQQSKAEPGTAIPAVDMGHCPVMNDFIQAVKTGHDAFVNGQEARKAVAIICAIYQSGRNNGSLVKMGER